VVCLDQVGSEQFKQYCREISVTDFKGDYGNKGFADGEHCGSRVVDIRADPAPPCVDKECGEEISL